jgi:hypothetical protein
MKTYIVKTVESETWTREYRVEAESEEEAEDIVRHNAWQLTDIVDEEYVETDYREIKAVKEEEEEYEYR